MSLYIRVLRKKISYEYKRNKDKRDDWFNNDNNNMLDELKLYADEAILFSTKVQTVSNIPGGRFVDTVAKGPFRMKCFVDNRNFYGRIHGICKTFDLEGEFIDLNSIEKTDNTRWLVHDTQSQKPKPPMQLTRVAWSAGCFIMAPSNLAALGDILDSFKIMPNDFIDGELTEE